MAERFTNLKTETFSKEIDVADFVENCVDVAYFNECCSQCPNYGKTWSCPPYDFDPLDIWNDYKTFFVYARKVYTPQDLLEKTYDLADIIRIGGELTMGSFINVDDEMTLLQKEFPGSRVIGGGRCTLCGKDKCARIFGEPCRFPDKMTYSIESLGGNVEKVLDRYFNEKIYWGADGHLAPSYIRIGGLLKK